MSSFCVVIQGIGLGFLCRLKVQEYVLYCDADIELGFYA